VCLIPLDISKAPPGREQRVGQTRSEALP
jgi:hypothetical protein